MITRIFNGYNLAELEEHLSEIAPDLRLVVSAGRRPTFQVSSQLTEIGELKIWWNDYSEGFGIINRSRPDNIHLSIPARGGLELDSPDMVIASKGQILIYNLMEAKEIRVNPSTNTIGLSIAIEVINARLSKLLDRPIHRAPHFNSLVETAKDGGAAVQCVLRSLLFAASTNQPARSTPAQLRISTALIDLVLESLPHTHSEALHKPPPRIAPRQVRRAISYIHDNPMPPLTIDELAAICDVSVRSLQYTFRAFVGMAPGEYWRRVRLNNAVQEIKRDKLGAGRKWPRHGDSVILHASTHYARNQI